MDWLDYREKLGIGFNDEQKVIYFFTKIFNILDDLVPDMNSQINANEYFTFCNTTGTQMQDIQFASSAYSVVIRILHSHAKSLEEFLAYYVAFLNCQKDADHKSWKREHFKNAISNLLDQSHLTFEVIEDADGYFIFPKGVKEMDDALVSQPLHWLASYPRTEKAWGKALRKYADGTPDDASDVADLFRKALEAFFQEFFNSSKSLENYKGIYGAHLKSHGIPKEISANFETLLQSYTNFINNYAKHRDATSDTILEYIMYQTGNIIRLLITLK